jgi:hypothetical protein
MAAPVIQFKRGAFINLPGLQVGEPALTTDTYDFYVGIDSTTNNNKFFGSHRYWTKETTATGSALNLVEGTLNGASYISLKSPDALAANLTYTLPGLQGASSTVLTNDGSGNLSWSSGSNNATFTGITTFSDTTDSGTSTDGAVRIAGGLGVAKSLNVGSNFSVAGVSTFVGNVTFQGGTINLGDSNTDNVVFAADVNSNIIPNTDDTYDFGNSTQRWRNASFSGIVTTTSIDATTGSFTNLIGTLTGTISTATRATLVDTTTAPTGTFYPGLFVSNTGTASTAVYVDAGISYVSNTDTLTLTGDIAVNGGDVTTTLETATVFNTNATTVNAFGAATALVIGDATGITTVRNKLTVGGNLEVDGNNIQASDGNTNITLTSNTLTTFAGDIKVTGNDIQSSSATAITLSGADVAVAGNLTVSGNLIKSSTGATAITLAANDVTVADDLTVQGNLYVNGNTTQVNTTSLTVEDRTIDLGIVDGAAPTSATTWDLGVLFNYYTDAAKKSAVIWEHADTRFKFASVLGSDTNGSNNDTPQLTVTTFAPIEIGALWVNDCAGQSQVINCAAGVRTLENITIDAGTF